MALGGPCQMVHLGRIRGRESEAAVGSCLGPSVCHILSLRVPNSDTLTPSNFKLVLPEARAWSRCRRVCVFRGKREGRPLKVPVSDLAENPAGASDERIGNWAIGLDNNTEDNEKREIPAVSDNSYDINNSKDTSMIGSSSSFIADRVTLPGDEIASLGSNTLELSDWSKGQGVGRSGVLQGAFLEHEKEFFEPEKKPCVSLVWEAGLEIEKLMPDMESVQDGKDRKDHYLSSINGEEQQDQEKLRTLEKILATFPESEDELDAREAELLAFSNKLMNECAMSQEAYGVSQKALFKAEGMIIQLDTQVGQLKEDVASRDALMRLLQKEAHISSEFLQTAAQSLSDAERRIVDLEKQVQVGEQSVLEEKEKVMAAVKWAAVLEQAARVAESKTLKLAAEISSLKELASSARRAKQLGAQVNALEEELRSRDLLFLEIKEESKRSTEALKLAAEIKQDLNATRQREVQLTQALESANAVVKELQTEILENLRTLRAEQALNQMEKMLRDAKLEVELLRKGVEERDRAIYAMKDEVDLNIGLLSSAARDRGELHIMKLRMEELKSELRSKDAKLAIMREEMAAVINLAGQNQSGLMGRPSSNHTTLPPAASPSSVQISKPNNKSQARKQTRKQRISQSSPQQC